VQGGRSCFLLTRRWKENRALVVLGEGGTGDRMTHEEAGFLTVSSLLASSEKEEAA
jgi:hypothetical protein